jgi:periplasmic protein TonB
MVLSEKLRRYSSYVTGAALLIIVVIFAAWFLSPSDKQPEHKKVVHQVTLITLPPPPPPPPPEDQPEVPKEKEQVIDKPDEAMPDEDKGPDAGNELGLDADGSAGGDGFGLVARKGGRGVVGGGYGALVVQEINALLTDDDQLRHKAYTLVLSIWISPTGTIEKYKIDRQAGDEKVIAMVTSALTKMGSVSEGPPLEIPQPIRIRIKSRI